MPSLAIPPTPHIAPPKVPALMDADPHAVTLAVGSSSDAYGPAMIGTAISHAPKSNIKILPTIPSAESLLLDLRVKLIPL